MLADMSDLAIQVRDLHKSYGDVHAVRGIDLEVKKGEVFALLGPNGAGKTTTVEILEGHREPTSGEANVLGHDPQKRERDYLERIGIVLQETAVEPFLTVAEVIEMFRGFYPNPRPLDEVIEVVGLTEKKNSRVVKLSGGQQRRLDVAIGLAGDPELLFLDEPTTGFDPRARRDAWDMVKNLQSLGKTVFLTTHYMEEAEYLADRVAILTSGEIVGEGSPASLLREEGEGTSISFSLKPDDPDLPVELDQLGTRAGERVLIQTTSPLQVLHDLTGWALDSNIDLIDLSITRPTLEDVYLKLTGGEAHVEAAE
jgi:ABC-2 type transport system ATP-binding protein